ncbi:NADP-dependent malic enzyme [Arsenophonus endosymbiont of Bemisia tabaci Q2]|nr:NADP-dependent malic enzyme [Arsenophonus endosymbiont of Bemisia tabaci Q2]
MHAIQELISLGLAYPILIGRPSVIEKRIEKLGLQIKIGEDFELINNENDSRFKTYWQQYYQLMKRHGVSQEMARREVINNPTLIAALMIPAKVKPMA